MNRKRNKNSQKGAKNSEKDYILFNSGKKICKKHYKIQCAECNLSTNRPIFPLEKAKKRKVMSSKIPDQTRSKADKSRRVIERFHSYRVRFDALVDWDKVKAEVKFLDRTMYKRLDFDQGYVLIFSKSIFVVLRRKAEIIGLPVREAKAKADLLIHSIIVQLPNAIKVHDPIPKSMHNAFMNHPTAQYDIHVKIDGESRLITDRSKGTEEFEAVHPIHAVTDSEHLEAFNSDLITKPYYLPSDIKYAIDHLIEVQKKTMEAEEYYAENRKSHVGSIQELGIAVRELTFLIKRRLK